MYYEYMTIQNKQKRLVASTLADLSIGARAASPGDDVPKMGDGLPINATNRDEQGTPCSNTQRNGPYQMLRGFTGTQLGSARGFSWRQIS